MGEPNNALKAYVNRADRIRDLLEYYLGEKLPEDWQCQEISGFVTVRNSKGKLSFRERDFLGKACAWGFHFRLGLENQDSVNLIYPWRLMEWDCLTYRIPKSAVDVIDACTNIKRIRDYLQYQLNQESREEEADMCKALDDIEKAAVRKGIKQGEKRGEKRGERKGTLTTLFSLVNDGLLKLEEAAKRANLSEQAFRSEMKKAGFRSNSRI